MTDENRIYFRQLLTGTHLAKADTSAAQMANFIYLVGDKVTKECVVIDPAWDIEGLLKIVENDGMKLTGALVTHYHADHVGGSIFGMQIQGLSELMVSNPVPIFVNKHEADGVIQVTGVSKSDLRIMDNQDTYKVGEIEISFMHTPGHTPGSQCFMVKDNLLAGDTLFLQGCGRVDLPGGDSKVMYETLTTRLSKIEGGTILYPGHNYGGKPSAPMEDVRRENHYLQVKSLDDWLSFMGG